MHKILIAGAATVLFAGALRALPPAPSGEVKFRELYKELVETNTTLSAGSCTLAAQRMAARLRAAGIADSDLIPFAAPDHPNEGGLVAIYPGRDPKRKAVLLLAHLDVVEAKREDWVRDPFTLVEENGAFYARGAVDDKAEAAIWVDTLIRYRQENFRPLRTISTARNGSRKIGATSSMRRSRSTKARPENSVWTASASPWKFRPARRHRRTSGSKSRTRAATAPGRSRTTPSTAWLRRSRASRPTSFPRNSPTGIAPISRGWRASKPPRGQMT